MLRLFYNCKKKHVLCNSFKFIRSPVRIYSRSFKISSFEIGHFVLSLTLLFILSSS